MNNECQTASESEKDSTVWRVGNSSEGLYISDFENFMQLAGKGIEDCRAILITFFIQLCISSSSFPSIQNLSARWMYSVHWGLESIVHTSDASNIHWNTEMLMASACTTGMSKEGKVLIENPWMNGASFFMISVKIESGSFFSSVGLKNHWMPPAWVLQSMITNDIWYSALRTGAQRYIHTIGIITKQDSLVCMVFRHTRRAWCRMAPFLTRSTAICKCLWVTVWISSRLMRINGTSPNRFLILPFR